MTVQMPDFSSDPNAVPKSDPFGNVLRGYQLSQLPAQMKAQRAKAQQDAQHAADVNKFYPLAQQQGLDLGQENIQSKQIANQSAPGLNAALLNQRNAQASLYGQQANKYGALTDSQINRNNAEAAKAGQPTNGVAITGYDEQGRPIIQVGGSGGTSARNGGRTGVDENGNIVSELTQGNKTAIQNKVIGQEVVKPFLDEVIKNVPQFQTPERKAQLAASSIFNQFGLAKWQDNNPYAQTFGLSSNLPSQKAAGDAAITNSVEGLLKQMNLKANDQQVAMVQKALAPQPGESESGYRDRATKFIQDLDTNTNSGKKFLATGVNTGVNTNGPYNNVTNAPQPQVQPQQAPQQMPPQQAPAPNPGLAHLTDEQLAQIANGGR